MATQALFLMNSPFVSKQAQHFAQRILSSPQSTVEERVTLAYQLTLTRDPTQPERARAIVFLGEAGPAEWQQLCQSIFCMNEFCYLE